MTDYSRVPNKRKGAFNSTEEKKTARINKRTVHNKRTEGAKLSKLIIVQGILIVQG